MVADVIDAMHAVVVRCRPKQSKPSRTKSSSSPAYSEDKFDSSSGSDEDQGCDDEQGDEMLYVPVETDDDEEEICVRSASSDHSHASDSRSSSSSGSRSSRQTRQTEDGQHESALIFF